LIVGNYYVLTLLVFIAATACALVLTRRLRPERAADPEPDAVWAARPPGRPLQLMALSRRYGVSTRRRRLFG
jgi:hypothetical protein